MKRFILVTGVSALLLISVTSFFMLYSNVGLAVSIDMISRVTGYDISFRSSSGRLLGAWEMKDLRVRSAETEIFIEKLSVNWHPGDLLQGTLRVASLQTAGVTVTLGEAQTDSAQDLEVLSLPEISLPLAIVANELLIHDLSISRKGQDRLLWIEHISTAFSARQSAISIAELIVKLPQYQARVEGNVVTLEKWTTDLTGTWRLYKDECTDVEGQFILNGSPDKLSVLLTTSKPERVHIEGTFFGLLDNPRWELDGSAEIFLPNVCDTLAPLGGALSIHSEGGPSAYQLQVQTDLQHPNLPKIEGSLFIEGNKEALVIERSSIRFDDNEVELSGQFSWREDLNWSFSLSTNSLDFSPYQKFAAGSIDIEFNSSGSLVENRLSYNGSIPKLNVVLEDAGRTLNGSFEFQGDDRGIEILTAHVAVEEALVEMEGDIGWYEGLNWQVSSRFDHFDPARWGEHPEGSIEGSIDSIGRIEDSVIKAEATISSLSGELAGYPVEGGGTVEILPEELIIRDLFLLSGANSLAVDGKIGNSFDVRFSLDGPDLNQLHDRIEGRVNISGSIHGQRKQPLVDFLASADEFSYDGYSLKSFEASGTVDDHGDMKISLRLDGLQKNKAPFEELAETIEAVISGNVEDHIFSIKAFSDFGELTMQGTGSVSDMSSWSGVFEDMEYEHPLYGTWLLKESAMVALSSKTASIENFCLNGSESGGCADGVWSQTEGWQADFSRLLFDLSNLERWNLLTYPVEGELRGEFNVAGDGATVNRGIAHLSMDQLYLEGSKELYDGELKLTGTVLTLKLEDQVLKTSLRTRADKGAHLAMGLIIDTSGERSIPFHDLPLDGELLVEIEDLNRLAVITGDMVIPEGRIRADFDIGGVLKNPDLHGSVKLEEGGLFFPDYGLRLKEIAAEFQGGRQGFKVNVTATSGDGHGMVDGNVRFAEKSWTGDLVITGQNLQLLNQHELQIAGNPDLHLTISPKGGKLSGAIFIPQAKFEPEEITNSYTMSRDTLFVDEHDITADVPFHFDLAIELGDDIQVKGYGFEGSLLGSLGLFNAGTDEIRGRGEVQVKGGTVSFMGRTIEISRGIIVFSGGPVDNPTLDIQARKIINRERAGTNNIIVGLNITGSVQNYHVELFSDPMMADREIIAALLFDRPLNSDENTGLVDSAVRLMGVSGGNNILGRVGERLPVATSVNLRKDSGQGDVSLVFGRQITNRLSAGYDLNLFDNQGQFRVRYSLPRGFSLEVRNSVDVTGVELLYNFGK